MLSPVAAYPILAKNGHSSIGNSTLTAEIVLSPIVAYPFLAKIGHSSVGNSTLTADIMFSLYTILLEKLKEEERNVPFILFSVL